MSTMRRETLDPKSYLYYAPRRVRERVSAIEGEIEPEPNETPKGPSETPKGPPVDLLPLFISPPLADRPLNGGRHLPEPETNIESVADVRRVARRSLVVAIAACAVSAAGVAAALLVIEPIHLLDRTPSILAFDGGNLSISTRLGTTGLGRTEPPLQEAALPLPFKLAGVAAKQPPSAGKNKRIEPVEVQAPAVAAPKIKTASAADAPKIKAAPAPAVRTTDPDQVAALMKRAHALIEAGDLPAARLILQWVAETHNARAAYELGMTFDPAFIKRLGAVSVLPDLARARTWYEYARDWGSSTASQRLQSLAAEDMSAASGK
jgi:hypothetical protein